MQSRTINRQVTLARRPQGAPRPEDFKLLEAPLPSPGEGQVLLRTLWLSLDPYMRGRMSEGPSYATPVAIGQPMGAGTVSDVVESRHPGFRPGDRVLSYAGWQDFAVAKGKELRKLDPAQAPLSTALGVLGMPGFTAWWGLTQIGQPKPEDCVVVAAATGPVGSLVAQLARLRGAHVVPIAGGADKQDWLRNGLGLAAALDHRAPDFAAALAKACPKGIDVYFENVGGHVLDAVLPLLNVGARMPVCGLIARYNSDAAPAGPDRMPGLLFAVLRLRLRLQGFIISDHYDRFAEFHAEVAPLVRDGRIAYREDVVEGLEKAPEAFIGLLEGRNFGKLLVKVAE